MNGIEKITARIVSDAENDIVALQSDTLARCEEIKSRAEEDAERIRREVMQASATKTAERKERAHSVAALEVKKQILAVKRELIELAFERAAEQLRTLPQEEYESLLAKLAANAAEGTEKVILSAADRARVGKKVVVTANQILERQGKTGGLTLSEQTRDIKGGVILENGRVETNCSFESLIEFNKSKLTGEVAAILFD